MRLAERKIHKEDKWGLYSLKLELESMVSIVKGIFLSLLCLFQILSPWVHAHTGEETGARLHVPGLERFFTDDQGISAQKWDFASDLIVSVQAGFNQRSDSGSDPDSDPQLVILNSNYPMITGFKPHYHWISADFPVRQSQFHLGHHSPRAPPFFS